MRAALIFGLLVFLFAGPAAASCSEPREPSCIAWKHIP